MDCLRLQNFLLHRVVMSSLTLEILSNYPVAADGTKDLRRD